VNPETLVQVKQLRKFFAIGAGAKSPFRKSLVRAIDGVDLDIIRGETLGLVGESGCGKTTLGRCILRLTGITSGQIFFESRDITRLPKRDMRLLRKNMQIIFQDPFSSLDPRMKVGDIVGQPLNVFKNQEYSPKRERVTELLVAVGLEADHMERYPHEFSGGQRQRIAIARSLVLNPQFIIADEPVSALDVSIRAQILNLMRDLKNQFKLTYLYISHDLSTVKFISDRVAVMYMGRMVETAPVKALFEKPLHPYTRTLMEAVPIPNPLLRKDRQRMKGEPPSPISPPSGCRFHPRCPRAMRVCEKDEPGQTRVGPDRQVACHLPLG
jgi:oligopeptide transport system ATP-binding protein